MKNILITGGAGFIGSNFIHHINQNPQFNLLNLDKLTYAGFLSHLNHLPHPEQHNFIEGDICDADLVQKLMQTHNIDTIVHFAAESHVDRSIAGPAEFITTNIVGTFTLLEAAKKHWQQQGDYRFHHISTDEVYGSLSPTDPAFSETTAYDPNSPYSASKASSDHLVRAYHATYGLPVTLSNCSNNYGPRQHTEKLIPTVIKACMNRQPIPVYGDGSNIRDWLYVTDHCEAIQKILQLGKNGETYNIGGDAEWSNIELVRLICQLMDELYPSDKPYEQLIHFVKDRPGHDWRYAINNHKIKSELNWTAKESLETGLRKTIQFYLQKLL